MLSFQIAESGKFIQVNCDAFGLDSLISALEKYRDTGGEGHLHLRAPSAGGSLLSDTTPYGKDAVCEVIVSLGGDD